MAHGAPANGSAVSIGFATYAPAALDVLVGEPVTWANDSVRAHTVTADDASFDSGRLISGQRFTRAFTAEGEVPYHCELHAGMVGTIGVHTLLLDVPRHAAAPGRAFPLTGRAALPQGTSVVIEADAGGGFAPVGQASVRADGSYATAVTPATSGRYRAVAGTAASPEVPLTVLDHRITLAVRRLAGGRVALSTRVTPAAPGGTVVLQLFLPEHFGWWPVRQLRLGRDSRAAVVLRLRRRVAARLLLTLPDGATPLAITPVRRVGPTVRRAAAAGS
jgi:hypothetical protein